MDSTPLQPLWLLHQTLHGYRDGHELLATSVKLTPEEDLQLRQLSDLSGPIPPKFEVLPYELGFSCGRFYAFARTWVDPSVDRGGAVITHTLLIPLRRLAELPDLYQLAAHFEAPPDKKTVEKWREQRAVTLEPVAAPVLTEDERLKALSLYFSEQPLPLIVTPAEQSRSILRFLWRYLTATERAMLSFCTLALRPVSFRSQILQLLGAPAEASTAYVKFYQHPTHWQRPVLSTPSILDTLAGSCPEPDAFRLAYEQAKADGIKLEPRTGPLLAWKLLRLERESQTNAITAVAVLDLLEAYGQQANPERWQRALRQHLEHLQRTPPTHPLRVLCDLLSRPRVNELVQDDEGFLIFFVQQVSRARELAQLHGEALEKLQRLVQGTPLSRYVLLPLEELLSLEGLTGLSDPELRAIFPKLLDSYELLRRQLDTLPGEKRIAQSLRLRHMASAEQQPLLAHHMRACVKALEDVTLLHEWMKPCSDQDYLQEITTLWTADEALVAHLKDAMKWVHLSSFIQWLQQQFWDESAGRELSRLCASRVPLTREKGEQLLSWLSPDTIQSTRIWCAYVNRSPEWDWQTHESAQAFFPQLLKLLQHFDDRDSAMRVLNGMLPSLPLPSLLSPMGFELLQHLNYYQDVERTYYQTLLPQILSRVLSASVPKESNDRASVDARMMQQWLERPEVLQFIRDRARQKELSFRKLHTEPVHIQTQALIELLYSPAGRALRENRHFDLSGLIRMATDRATPSEIQAALPRWEKLLWDATQQDEVIDCLIAALFSAADRHPNLNLSTAMAAAYMPAYEEFKDGRHEREPSFFMQIVRVFDIFNFFTESDWDKGSALRQKLISLWYKRGWSAVHLVRACRGEYKHLKWFVKDAKEMKRLELFRTALKELEAAPHGMEEGRWWLRDLLS